MQQNMHVRLYIAVLIPVFAFNACGGARPASTASMLSGIDIPKRADTIAFHSERSKVDFESQLRPIFESRCMPCHFAGGKMYERLPFDRPETIKLLGSKLFTRIKDENERRLIREFLAQ